MVQYNRIGEFDEKRDTPRPYTCDCLVYVEPPTIKTFEGANVLLEAEEGLVLRHEDILVHAPLAKSRYIYAQTSFFLFHVA